MTCGETLGNAIAPDLLNSSERGAKVSRVCSLNPDSVLFACTKYLHQILRPYPWFLFRNLLVTLSEFSERRDKGVLPIDIDLLQAGSRKHPKLCHPRMAHAKILECHIFGIMLSINSGRGCHDYRFYSGPRTGASGATVPRPTTVLPKVNNDQVCPREETTTSVCFNAAGSSHLKTHLQ